MICSNLELPVALELRFSPFQSYSVQFNLISSIESQPLVIMSIYSFIHPPLLIPVPRAYTAHRRGKRSSSLPQTASSLLLLPLINRRCLALRCPHTSSPHLYSRNSRHLPERIPSPSGRLSAAFSASKGKVYPEQHLHLCIFFTTFVLLSLLWLEAPFAHIERQCDIAG